MNKNKLCCILNSVELNLSGCSCDILMCEACLSEWQSKTSQLFATYNGVADYHFRVSPKCPGVKRYMSNLRKPWEPRL
jgi:hypothetical protein